MTQVSPAKLALRHHLSQERLTPHPSEERSNLLATRNVGELITSEIVRALESVPSCRDVKDPAPRDMYSPISRPGSADNLEGLAYPHPNLQTLAHVAFSSGSRGHVNGVPQHRYTPVALPRAEMKPCQESLFADVKPPSFAPVEGLAASLSARVLYSKEVHFSLVHRPVLSWILTVEFSFSAGPF